MLSQKSKIEEKSNLSNFDVEQQDYVGEVKKVGFTKYAERLHGRLAMIGFTSLLAIAILTKHGLISPMSNF